MSDENGVALSAIDEHPTIPDLSDPEGFVRELSAEMRYFESQSSVRVRIGPRIVSFRIRSVSKEQLEEALLLLRPKLPKYRDKQTGALLIDEESPAYRNWLRTYAYLKVVLGLADLTIRDTRGRIVWQADGDVQEMAAAIQALKDMGITTLQVEAISEAIDTLSRIEMEQEAADLLGNSDGDLPFLPRSGHGSSGSQVNRRP